MAKSDVTKVPFAEVVKQASVSSGVSEKDIRNSFTAVKNQIESIIAEKRPAKPGSELLISTPFSSFKFTRVEETEENGKIYPERIRIAPSIPKSYFEIANRGLDIKPRAVEEKAAKKKKAA